MRKVVPVLLCCLLFSMHSQAQNPSYSARYLVDTLCSEYFYGRGYVNNGVNRAAYFLSRQFDSLGIRPLGEKYFQEFALPVNIFHGKMALSINGNALEPGKDFQVLPESGCGKKSLKVVWADTLSLGIPPNHNKEVTAIPANWFNKLPREKRLEIIGTMASKGPLIIGSGEKLTWSVGAEQLKYPVFEVRPEFLKNIVTARYSVEALMDTNFYCDNVCAVVPGNAVPDSFLVLTAHYDHLGGMGNKVFIQGANDNASGTAMLLTLAEHFRRNPHRYSIVFIAFAGEEAGLKGSRHFVENPLIKLQNIRFLFNLDLMGTGAEGATVVNATVFPKDFDKLTAINTEKGYLPAIHPRGEAANSDHYWFTELGIPSFFMYLMDSKYTAYHNISDRKQDLPLTRFKETQNLLIDFFNSF